MMMMLVLLLLVMRGRKTLCDPARAVRQFQHKTQWGDGTQPRRLLLIDAPVCSACVHA
jgi:hypothetical protein